MHLHTLLIYSGHLTLFQATDAFQHSHHLVISNTTPSLDPAHLTIILQETGVSTADSAKHQVALLGEELNVLVGAKTGRRE